MQREREKECSHWGVHSASAQISRSELDKVGIWELNLGFQSGWQEPGYLELPLLPPSSRSCNWEKVLALNLGILTRDTGIYTIILISTPKAQPQVMLY